MFLKMIKSVLGLCLWRAIVLKLISTWEGWYKMMSIPKFLVVGAQKLSLVHLSFKSRNKALQKMTLNSNPCLWCVLRLADHHWRAFSLHWSSKPQNMLNFNVLPLSFKGLGAAIRYSAQQHRRKRLWSSHGHGSPPMDMAGRIMGGHIVENTSQNTLGPHRNQIIPTHMCKGICNSKTIRRLIIGFRKTWIDRRRHINRRLRLWTLHGVCKVLKINSWRVPQNRGIIGRIYRSVHYSIGF